MECTTFSHIDEKTGERIHKPKLFYKTHFEAENQAKLQNIEYEKKYVLKAYKCTKCKKYHIGRNGDIITEEYLKEIKKTVRLQGLKILGKIELPKETKKYSNNTQGLKIVGKIDLNKISTRYENRASLSHRSKH